MACIARAGRGAVPAFAAETVVDTIQGEDASKVSGKRVEPVTVFYSDGRVEKNVNLPRRATKLVVKADSGPKCGDEWPHMVVEVDKVPVLSTTVQENGNTSSPVNVPAGRHTVAVSYDNDYYEPADAFTSNPRKPLTCDRNLTLDAIALLADENTEPAPAPPPSPGPTPRLRRRLRRHPRRRRRPGLHRRRRHHRPRLRRLRR